MASFPRILAVDLGASAVRLVELGPDGKGRPTLLSLIEEEIPFDPAKTSDFFPLYASALTAAVARLPSKTRQCHLCLGGPAVFARILKVPAADAGQVGSMIRFEAQQTVPAIEQALWDYQVIPSPQAGEAEALILAIKRETVEELSAAAASAGLKPQSVTLVPAAILNGFFYNYPEASGCHLIMEIGARATTILLVEGSRIFVRVVPLGGVAISQAVATDLQESFAGAETLKRAKGFVHPGGAYEDPADAATARISKLARGVMTRLHTEVERSVTFFRSQQGGGKPVQAWLAGGGVTLGYTELFFREKLTIPVDYFQPFRRLGLPASPEGQIAARKFSVWGAAVGTALQALPEVPVRINVLGAIARAQAQKNRDVPAMVVAAVAGAGLLLLPGVHGFWQAAKVGGRLAEQTTRVDEASGALQKLEMENKKLFTVVQRAELALKLERERFRWPQLLAELKRHSQKKVWITSLQEVTALEVAETAAPAKQGAEPPVPVVEIGGMFETQSEKADAEAVANFQRALEAGGVLRKVEILEREAPQYVDGKTDQVALKFRLKAEWPMEASSQTPSSGGGG
jgi:type IV pilus assembly protein PilM